MSGLNYSEYTDEFEGFEQDFRIRNMSANSRGANPRKDKKSRVQADNAVQLAGGYDDRLQSKFSYSASRHEAAWLLNSLGEFFEQHWLDDVLRLVKGGKEANVYQCLANPSVKGLEQPYLAAKVYRPRRFRNLKNDLLYREGRTDLDSDGNLIIDDGMQHAIAKKTEYGRELLHTSWIEHEVMTMELLSEAGGDVPQIFASENNAILMSFIGDDQTAAPILSSVRLKPKQAARLFERVVHNMELMLAVNRVHGDFSAYNILFWDDEITIIDFPQSIDPHLNRNAFRIFERDAVRICEYFSRQGVKSNPHQLAADLWQAHHLRAIPDVHPKMLDVENEADRAYWKEWSSGEI